MTFEELLPTLSILWTLCFLVELSLYKIEKAAWKKRLGSNYRAGRRNGLVIYIPMYALAPLWLSLHAYELIKNGGFAK